MGMIPQGYHDCCEIWWTVQGGTMSLGLGQCKVCGHRFIPHQCRCALIVVHCEVTPCTIMVVSWYSTTPWNMSNSGCMLEIYQGITVFLVFCAVYKAHVVVEKTCCRKWELLRKYVRKLSVSQHHFLGLLEWWCPLYTFCRRTSESSVCGTWSPISWKYLPIRDWVAVRTHFLPLLGNLTMRHLYS